MARFTAWVLAGAIMSACTASNDDPGQPGNDYAGTIGDGSGSGQGTTMPADTAITLSTGCPACGPDVYTPYVEWGPVFRR